MAYACFDAAYLQYSTPVNFQHIVDRRESCVTPGILAPRMPNTVAVPVLDDGCG